MRQCLRIIIWIWSENQPNKWIRERNTEINNEIIHLKIMPFIPNRQIMLHSVNISVLVHNTFSFLCLFFSNIGYISIFVINGEKPKMFCVKIWLVIFGYPIKPYIRFHQHNIVFIGLVTPMHLHSSIWTFSSTATPHSAHNRIDGIKFETIIWVCDSFYSYTYTLVQ